MTKGPLSIGKVGAIHRIKHDKIHCVEIHPDENKMAGFLIPNTRILNNINITSEVPANHEKMPGSYDPKASVGILAE